MDVAIKKVRNGIDRIFDKTLQDLVRGVRNHKGKEREYISEAVEEIREELKHPHADVKAVAITKLCFLQMLGYEMGWAAFPIVEVMSSTKLSEKRLGYWAASQCFHVETDVLMLTTNLIKKDIIKGTEWEAGVALGGLSCFMTPDLAQDLMDDIISLMCSTRPYVRKRATLVSYKLFLHYPDALRAAMPRLKEKLEDKDAGVQAAAVNVICELARKNPKNYLPLSPVLLRLMSKSSNNWVLIKIIKLFGCLIPHEPRLGKKLEEPLKNLINNTSAMSLLYECINTLIQAKTYQATANGNDNETLIQLCVDKLRILIEDNDQNLKYLGLLSMIRILDTHPKAVTQHKDIIMTCLDDKDESIRLRALDLISRMVTKTTIMEIVAKLLDHAKKTENMIYRDDLVSKLIQMCAQSNYANIHNFEWYLNVLLDLTKLEGKSKFGDKIAFQILDVTIRVKTLRVYSVAQMSHILTNLMVISTVFTKNGCLAVLRSAALICGEFADLVTDPVALLDILLNKQNCFLPEDTVAVFLQNALKLFAAGIKDSPVDEASKLFDKTIESYRGFLTASSIDIQERANAALQTILFLQKLNSTSILTDLFEGDLKPVGAKAQKKVPMPNGLNLDEWIVPQSEDEEEDDEEDDDDDECDNNAANRDDNDIDQAVFEYRNSQIQSPLDSNVTSPTIPKAKTIAKLRITDDINYLKTDTKQATKPADFDDYQSILSPESEPNQIFSNMGGSEKYLQTEKSAKKEKIKKKKKRKTKATVEEVAQPSVEILDEEMPEGAELTPDETDEETEAKKLNIDVSDLLTVHPKTESKTKKKLKKKKKSSKAVVAHPSSSDDEDDKVAVASKHSADLINNTFLIVENVDLRIEAELGTKQLDNQIQLQLTATNRHKSRQIKNVTFDPMPDIPNNQFSLAKGDSNCIPFISAGDAIRGQVTYEVESKSKAFREKKLKFEKTFSPFERCGAWKVDDDELVDLLHEKFFVNCREEKIKTHCSSLSSVIEQFNGAYLVQQAANGASICGQIGTDGPKFVTLVKFNPKDVEHNLNVVLKTETDESEALFFAAIESILT